MAALVTRQPAGAPGHIGGRFAETRRRETLAALPQTTPGPFDHDGTCRFCREIDALNEAGICKPCDSNDREGHPEWFLAHTSTPLNRA